MPPTAPVALPASGMVSDLKNLPLSKLVPLVQNKQTTLGTPVHNESGKVHGLIVKRKFTSGAMEGLGKRPTSSPDDYPGPVKKLKEPSPGKDKNNSATVVKSDLPANLGPIPALSNLPPTIPVLPPIMANSPRRLMPSAIEIKLTTPSPNPSPNRPMRPSQLTATKPKTTSPLMGSNEVITIEETTGDTAQMPIVIKTDVKVESVDENVN